MSFSGGKVSMACQVVCLTCTGIWKINLLRLKYSNYVIKFLLSGYVWDVKRETFNSGVSAMEAAHHRFATKTSLRA